MTSGLVMTAILWSIVTAVLVTGGVALGYELGRRGERNRLRKLVVRRVARGQATGSRR